jgi:DNA-binding NarL/FixJ family response regulator
MNSTHRVLVADDHRIVIDGIRSMLEGTPYQVVADAANGQEAMDIIGSAAGNFDMLITDISMPLLSGTDLCKMVKHSFPTIKVLILSMYSSAPMVKEAVLSEADGFMLKNSGKEELLQALHRIVHDGTFYSDAIIPIIYGQIEKEKKQRESTDILSDREREVLKLIAEELTSEEIAERLFISKRTVDNHRTNMLEKTGCRSTIGLVKYALRNGLC